MGTETWKQHPDSCKMDVDNLQMPDEEVGHLDAGANMCSLKHRVGLCVIQEAGLGGCWLIQWRLI